MGCRGMDYWQGERGREGRQEWRGARSGRRVVGGDLTPWVTFLLLVQCDACDATLHTR